MTFIKVADGDRITISLSSKNQRVDRAKPKSKGPIRRKKDPKYETRRLAQSGIEIYDCGQILSGESYIDIPFSRDGTLLGYPGDRPDYEFTSSDFDALEDYLFLTPLNQWSSKYRKLSFDEGYKYPVDIDFQNPSSNLRSAAKLNQRYNRNNDLTSGAGWSSGGMEQVSHSAFDIYGFLAFNYISSATDLKITATRDYSAANIPGWTIPARCKIFLLPLIVTTGIYFEQNVGGVDFDYWFALAPYTAISRSGFADRVISLSPEPNRPWLNYFTFINSLELFSSADIEYFLDTFLNSSARVYKAESRDFVTTWDEITHLEFPRSSLEAAPEDGILMMTQGIEMTTVPLYSTVIVQPGTLLAVVTSGSSEYYLWRT